MDGFRFASRKGGCNDRAYQVERRARTCAWATMQTTPWASMPSLLDSWGAEPRSYDGACFHVGFSGVAF